MDNPQISSPNTREKSLGITCEEFVEYLNKIDKTAKCSFCGKGEYGVYSNPTGTSTAIVATPVPNHSGVGIWFFPVTCIECGHTIFFSSAHVTRAIKGID